jgi:hypothetical protein
MELPIRQTRIVIYQARQNGRNRVESAMDSFTHAYCHYSPSRRAAR